MEVRERIRPFKDFDKNDESNLHIVTGLNDEKYVVV